MTTPYVDPQSVHNPATGTAPPAAWGDTMRDCVEMATKMPSACMTVTASQNLASGTTTAINCGGELWDTDAQHSTSTNTSRTRNSRPTCASQVQHSLSRIIQQLTSLSQQHAQLRLGVRRADMLHDPLTPADVLSDLYRRGTRPGPHPPNERHEPTVEDPIGA